MKTEPHQGKKITWNLRGGGKGSTHGIEISPLFPFFLGAFYMHRGGGGFSFFFPGFIGGGWVKRGKMLNFFAGKETPRKCFFKRCIYISYLPIGHGTVVL